MRFTKAYDANEQDQSTSNSADFIRYFKKPATTFRIVQDPPEWQTYWEHFNPGGFPFPCTGDKSECPGCTSANEKMSKANKRVAIQVLEDDFVNVYKFPITLADKLYNRFERIGTLKDRDYTIYKNSTKRADGSNQVDYDLEAEDKEEKNLRKLQLKDVDAMLASSYEDAWGNGNAIETKLRVVDDENVGKAKQAAKRAKQEDPPFEKGPSKTWTEDELRAMSPADLAIVLKNEGTDLPEKLKDADVDEVVDWLLEQ